MDAKSELARIVRSKDFARSTPEQQQDFIIGYFRNRQPSADHRAAFSQFDDAQQRKIADEAIEKLIRAHFDLRPFGILQMLDLIHPMYQATAAYGHFGRKPKLIENADGSSFTAFSWEQTDKADELKEAAKSL